jgi:hypothetical protein
MGRACSLRLYCTLVIIIICFACVKTYSKEELLNGLPDTDIFRDSEELYKANVLIREIIDLGEIDTSKSSDSLRVYRKDNYSLGIVTVETEYKSVYAYSMAKVFYLYKSESWLWSIFIVKSSDALPAIIFIMDTDIGEREILFFNKGKVKYIKRNYRISQTISKYGNELIPQANRKLISEEEIRY